MVDFNTMLSAAYDAYEAKVLEVQAARETMKEMADEIKALKDQIKDLKEESSALQASKKEAKAVEFTDN